MLRRRGRSARAGRPALPAACAVVALALALAGCAPVVTAGGPAAGRALHPRVRSDGCRARGPLPDPGCTPGSVITSDTARICQSGYARRARGVSLELKHAIYRAYGIRFRFPGAYEVDHLVPLELGGANDAANLWPQPASPAPGYHEKDTLENDLHDRVCAGRVSVAAAQRAIADDWVAAMRHFAR